MATVYSSSTVAHLENGQSRSRPQRLIHRSTASPPASPFSSSDGEGKARSMPELQLSQPAPPARSDVLLSWGMQLVFALHRVGEQRPRWRKRSTWLWKEANMRSKHSLRRWLLLAGFLLLLLCWLRARMAAVEPLSASSAPPASPSAASQPEPPQPPRSPADAVLVQRAVLPSPQPVAFSLQWSEDGPLEASSWDLSLEQLIALRVSRCSPRLLLIVFTRDRLASLRRLLVSVLAADFSQWQNVELRINVDHSAQQQEVRSYLDTLHWPHGPLHVRYASSHNGLARSILSSWQPRSLQEFGVFLEDDVELSPLFARWLWTALQVYYYAFPDTLRSHPMMGVSLYSPVWSERVDRPLLVSSPLPVYALQMPCSWGAVYFPLQWQEFVRWQEAQAAVDPLVPSLAGINRWSRHRSWKKFLIRFMVERGMWMLYPLTADRRSFSTNHVEPGTNLVYDDDWRQTLESRFTVPLMLTADAQWEAAHGSLWSQQLQQLPVLDIHERAVQLTDDLRISPPSAAQWSAFTSLTLVLTHSNWSLFDDGAVRAALLYWQGLELLAEAVVQLPDDLQFACPSPLSIGCRVNRVLSPASDAQYWPVAAVKTDAVLLLHPSIRLSHVDVRFAFYVWQLHPDLLVGILSHSAGFTHMRGRYQRWTSERRPPQFTVVATAAVILAHRYLDLYHAEEGQEGEAGTVSQAHAALRVQVQAAGRGEDVALNCLVGNSTGRWSVLLNLTLQADSASVWHQPVSAITSDLVMAHWAYGGVMPMQAARLFPAADDEDWKGRPLLPAKVTPPVRQTAGHSDTE